MFLDEHTVGTIHHHLADGIVEDEGQNSGPLAMVEEIIQNGNTFECVISKRLSRLLRLLGFSRSRE